MAFHLTDTIFWFSAICCAVAQTAILRSVVTTAAHAGPDDGFSPRRRVVDIMWAVLPGIALAAVFVFTWRLMHGATLPIPSAPSVTP